MSKTGEIMVAGGIVQREKPDSEREEYIDPDAPAIGRWYWVTTKEWDGKGYSPSKWLGCVTLVGTNFVEFTSAFGGTARIHTDDLPESTEPEAEAQKYIDQQIERHRRAANKLMAKVQEITKDLGVGMGPPKLTDGGAKEASALAIRNKDERPIEDYKKALVKAKEKSLPELFKKIEQENTSMGKWMKAGLIPLKAQAELMKPVIKAIENRIFNVELYAGLIEQVVQVADGKPAPISEKIHLFQRRAYMDEECLAEYRTGGMDFQGVEDFDKWMIEPANLNRLLPMPRCIIAFQVRRYSKDRAEVNLNPYVKIEMEEADKKTFLYMRNGERIFRLTTGVSFGEQLFPDMDTALLSGQKLYADISWHGTNFHRQEEGLVTESRYREMIKEDRDEHQKYEEKKARLIAEDKNNEAAQFWLREPEPKHEKYKLFDRDNIYFDEITSYLKEKMDEHNRLVLVLQGLLDRSPVFLPHPGWEIWKQDGFEAALALVYDDSKALNPGAAPDFEAYRNSLNYQNGVPTIRAGVVTVGQDDFWQRAEAVKENTRRHKDWRLRDYERYRDYEKYKPYGNNGPGVLAKVARLGGGKAVFTWFRDPVRYSRYKQDDIAAQIAVPFSDLLNVDAYKPGDFKKFFNDPRTRAQYLKWAPLLLEAEEYHAGNRPWDKKKKETDE